MGLLAENTLKTAGAALRPQMQKRNAVDEFADFIEEVITSFQKNVPENHKLRFYCQGKNGVDFRVGNIKISPSGVVIVSGTDDLGNSVYSVSHFERMQFVCEISKVDTNEPIERKPIGFSR